MKLLDVRIPVRRGLAAVRRWPKLVPSGRARAVSLVLGVLVFAGASTQVAVGWVTGLPGDAVLKVGDTVVTEEEFHRRVEVLRALYGVQPPEQGPGREKFNKDAAKSIAVGLIIDRAAQDQQVVIADKKAQEALTSIIEEQLPGGRDGFIEFLSSQGVSERDVLEEVRRQLATSRLFEQVTADVEPVTEEQVRQEFTNRDEEMVTAEQRQLRNIVVDSEDKAARVFEQARDGADFDKLAKEHSLDQSTKDSGGDLGTLSADQVEERFGDAAFDADEGEVFGPVRTEHGFNVGQVIAIIPGEKLSFKQVKGQLEADMNNQRTLEAWRDWLAGQIKRADVKYADDYRPDDPDAPPTDAPPQ